tara:strand:- start:454 stop:1146 length:693 start_codon:yes stop_codon:yes gene_type:complete
MRSNKKNKKLINIDLNKLEKNYVNKKLIKANFSTKLLAFIISTSLVISFGIFAYFYAGVVEKKIGDDDGEQKSENKIKTYTISRALAYSNKPGFIILTTLGFLYLFYLLCLRGPSTFFLRRLFLLSISFSFLLCLLWFTPSSNPVVHYTLASIIFSLILFFNLTTFYLFYKNKHRDRNLFLLMGLINIIAYVCLIVFAILRGRLDSDIFAAFEILFCLLFVTTIIFIGYY